MSKQKGFESYLYINLGSYGSPTWTEVDCITDVSIAEGADKLDATTRAQAREGFKGSEFGLADPSIKTTMLVPKHGETSAAYAALKTALQEKTTVDVLRTDGASKDHDGVEAMRMVAGVFGGDRKEPVAGITGQDVELSNIGDTNQQYPQYGTMTGGEFTPGS